MITPTRDRKAEAGRNKEKLPKTPWGQKEPRSPESQFRAGVAESTGFGANKAIIQIASLPPINVQLHTAMLTSTGSLEFKWDAEHRGPRASLRIEWVQNKQGFPPPSSSRPLLVKKPPMRKPA